VTACWKKGNGFFKIKGPQAGNVLLACKPSLICSKHATLSLYMYRRKEAYSAILHIQVYACIASRM